MAIAFNIPSEREATEENFSRLNRLLAELYEVLCHILVARQPGQEAQETMRRDRPYSESDIDHASSAPATSCRRSASSPPTNINLDAALDDDVFVSPRTDNGNDPFATRNIEIFGCGSPRTPAGVLLSPRRERQFTFSLSSEKQWRDKGGTEAAAAEESAATNDTDVTDGDAAPSSEDSHPPSVDAPRSIISTIFPSNVSSSICTAIILMLGWKLLSIKR